MAKKPENTAAKQAIETLRVAVGVDISASEVDEENGVIPGCVIAQAAPFKNADRGQFDQESLKTIVELAQKAPVGLACHAGHPTDENDGLGRELGRFRNFRLSQTGPRESDGRLLGSVPCVRADLFINPASRKSPFGDLGGHVMRLAKSDPGLISSSLVLTSDKQYVGTGGPVWRPIQIMGCDIVARGEAVDGLLSATLAATTYEDEYDQKETQPMQSVKCMTPGCNQEILDGYCLQCREKTAAEMPMPDKPAEMPMMSAGLDAARLAKLKGIEEALKQ